MLDWEKYSAIADRFQHKARFQDREDLRQAIILRLAEVAQRNGHKPFTEWAMLRVASYVVLEYWHSINQASVKVCIVSGIATKPNYAKCSYKDKPQSCALCAYRALRPIESLNTEIDDGEGNTEELIDTLADDKAIDLEAWVDAKVWLLGCPKRLVEIAHKTVKGQALTKTEHQYLWRFRKGGQKRLF